MYYLWNLLDLSTADNIALHIANFLVNAKEQYYQIMLEKENDERPAAMIKVDFSSAESVHYPCFILFINLMLLICR